MAKRISTLQVSFFFLMFGCCWVIVIGLQATSPSPMQTSTDSILAKIKKNPSTNKIPDFRVKSGLAKAEAKPEIKPEVKPEVKDACGDVIVEPIDVVYTWANVPNFGKTFIADRKLSVIGDIITSSFGHYFKATNQKPGKEAENDEDTSAQRFEDFNQLVYSLRGIQMFAPWIRHIYIVTNGQIPTWLNIKNQNISVISHNEIFPDKTHLPTFNSMAIEVHLHRIPGLSEKFIYFNDDIAFTKPICLKDFWNDKKGFQVFLQGSRGPARNFICPEKCISVKMADGTCDDECNTLACNWDGDDCDGISPSQGGTDTRPSFYQSIDFVDVLFSRNIGIG